MAAFDPANAVDMSAAADFVPELWSDEVIASYKANLVVAGLCTLFQHNGKKGDAINIQRQAIDQLNRAFRQLNNATFLDLD